MTVTVIGGSAQSTPVLLDFLGKNVNAASILIRLVGRDPGRLKAVARAGRLLAPELQVQNFQMKDLAQALTGSEIVLVQIRVGGYAGREFDESFPVRYGIPGDEGLGPGGLAAALRSWPVVRDILRASDRFCPEARVLLLTSPGSLLVRLAALEFPGKDVAGICELPLTTLQRVCKATGCRMQETSFGYAGVNHLGWLYSVNCGGRDLVAAYAAQADISMRDVIQRWGAIPLKYLRLHFESKTVVEEQSKGPSRSRQLEALRQKVMPVFLSGEIADIRTVLTMRDASWYADAVGPFIAASSHQSDAGPFFLSIADADGEVCERAYRMLNGQLQLVPMIEPPIAVSELNNRFLQYDRAAALAVSNPDIPALTHALKMHPWVAEKGSLAELSQEMFSLEATFV